MCSNTYKPETGRNKGLAEAERLCPFCNQGKNEAHVILNCSFYSDLQIELLNVAASILRDFQSLVVLKIFHYSLNPIFAFYCQDLQK